MLCIMASSPQTTYDEIMAKMMITFDDIGMMAASL